MDKYLDKSFSVKERIDDLLSKMTIEEKIRQLDMYFGCDIIDKQNQGILFTLAPNDAHIDEAKFDKIIGDKGVGIINCLFPEPKQANELQKLILQKSRLKIPAMIIEEALRGLLKQGLTFFPSQIALASTFDEQCAYNTGRIIASEARACGVHGALSPTMDLCREPRWGRVEESYGEDTYLSSRMAVNLVKGMQGESLERNDTIMAEPKHFACHGIPEGGLNCSTPHTSIRDIENNILPIFESAFVEGGAVNCMCSYNSIDGDVVAGNYDLLTKKLKQDWNLHGVCIDDLGAIGRQYSIHHTVESDYEAIIKSLNAGVDIQFYDYKHEDYTNYIIKAIKENRITLQTINEKVSRVLTLKFELGLFENPYIDESLYNERIRCKKNIEQSFEITKKSLILLKNDGILPLKDNNQKIAIVGPDATYPYFGGYAPHMDLNKVKLVSIFDGIKKRAKNCKVDYSKGVDGANLNFKNFEKTWLHTYDGKVGLNAKYYNDALSNDVLVEKVEEEIDYMWAMAKANNYVSDKGYRVEWTGYIQTQHDEEMDLAFLGDDSVKIFINNEIVIDSTGKDRLFNRVKHYVFKANVKYDIKIIFIRDGSGYSVRFCKYSIDKMQEIKALDLIEKSDIVVCCMGDVSGTCGEGCDRSNIDLPGNQREFLKKVLKLDKKVILVTQSGRPIDLSYENEHFNAMVHCWSMGENGGDAVAQLLFGDFSPSGKLPISFPKSVGHIPCHYNRLIGKSGNYLDSDSNALFPFGYGLSYTNFEYCNLKIKNEDDSIMITFNIKNIGNIDGDEIVQLYINDKVSSIVTPDKTLKRFERIFIKANETKELSFKLDLKDLKLLNKDYEWVVEKGDFEIMVGNSSNNILLHDNFTILKNYKF